MVIKRRAFFRRLLGLAGFGLLLRPFAVLAAWNKDAFSAVTEKDALDHFFPGESISSSDAITINAHDLVENGAYVPVQIESTLPAVDSITIVVEKNPNPLIASFDLSPECRAFIATRIKMAQPSDVVAVVKSNGRLFSARKFIKVEEGGCG